LSAWSAGLWAFEGDHEPVTTGAGVVIGQAVVMPAMSSSFPTVLIDSSWGRWWRIHSNQYGPWFFASCDAAARAAPSIGRFDLPLPEGTCYLGEDLGATLPESMREPNITAADSQMAANARHLSSMPLDRWYGRPIADFTSPGAASHGAPADVAAITRAQGREGALAARAAGFHGILYRLGQDPGLLDPSTGAVERRRGLALFGNAGDNPPAAQPPPSGLPAGLRNEVLALFNGEYRGDPLPI
jgi:hypothetical protein